MEFCPKCGSILVQKRKNSGCPRCNYTSKSELNIKTTEKGDKKEEIAIIDTKESKTLPIISGEKCKKCGNQKAYFWSVQTRAADEAEVKFFKCTKCDNTWREYR